jgi:hypothetical protein
MVDRGRVQPELPSCRPLARQINDTLEYTLQVATGAHTPSLVDGGWHVLHKAAEGRLFGQVRNQAGNYSKYEVIVVYPSGSLAKKWDPTRHPLPGD